MAKWFASCAMAMVSIQKIQIMKYIKIFIESWSRLWFIYLILLLTLALFFIAR